MTLNQATRQLTAAQDRVNEMQRRSRQGQVLIVLGLLVDVSAVVLGALVVPALGWLILVGLLTSVIGIYAWVFVNMGAEKTWGGAVQPVAPIVLVRSALAKAQDEYDEILQREIS